MRGSTFEMAVQFFGYLNDSDEGHRELSRLEKIIQFQVRDDESFWLDVHNGIVTVNKGMAPQNQVAVTFSPDRETLNSLFQRKLRVVDV